MAAPIIQPLAPIVPMIYAYTTPEIKRHDGWTKIGYTAKQTVEDRIKQQTHTVDVKAKLEWKDNAMYKDGSGEYFTDKNFHNYLKRHKGIEQEQSEDNEWFHVEPAPAYLYFNEFAQRTNIVADDEHFEYELRPEQAEAVELTKSYFEQGGTEFLWNAKPRFGKTLTAYDLVQQMDFRMVLVVTNRPAIANSWADDFNKFVGWRGKYCFVSENDVLSKSAGVVSRDEYLKIRVNAPVGEKPNMIAFESLQGLKGSVYFGGNYDKLKWISENEFDLLIVDESQEGVDTLKTERAFDNIKRKHTLYLSGTPFKALADGRFEADQIFNWSYVDEQKAKESWDGLTHNAYEQLPRLEMFTYQMSPMIEGELAKGAAISEDRNVDFTFDLNEFFETDERGTFKHKDSVEKFLDALTVQEKYPFSTQELRDELPHTLWLLNRVASAKALAKMLKEHPVFKDYEIVLAAGDGKLDVDDAAEKAFDKVRKAINENDKTITLSVGQLTVGVTVPEWSAVLMLSNMKSPSAYMQAAFRVQNPYETDAYINSKKMRVQKERAYVFDFDPARTLIVYEEFANNLNASTAGGKGTVADQKNNIRELLNFFPVIGEDSEGKMVEIDAQEVLSIPRRLKSVEVVRHGFMSNYLFDNIGNIFSAPSAVTEIITKLNPSDDKSFDAKQNTLDAMGEIPVDEYGDVSLSDEFVIGKSKDLFGDKVYEAIQDEVLDPLDDIDPTEDSADVQKNVRRVAEALKGSIEHHVIDFAVDEYGLRKSKKNQLVKESNNAIDREAKRIEADFMQSKRVAEIERDKRIAEAQTSKEVEQAQDDYNQSVSEALSSLNVAMQNMVKATSENQPKEVTKKVEEFKAQEEKNTVEDMVRAHLRGFSRTIPSFIMAYGDRDLRLDNFDDYTEDSVFEEVTGITEEQFRFLRDGGMYTDEATGEEKYFEGHLFNEVVFNDSIQQFLNKREELANYFDESNIEDIFDYIPPQKNNQIFTPRWVVKKMVDELEKENPRCFDDSSNTFADLYMKSGLYITEIVKRLYNSPKIISEFPDKEKRIRHILQHQVYGMAPTRIIYLIATNYILGFNKKLKDETTNFVEADATTAAKDGVLPELVDSYFARK